MKKFICENCKAEVTDNQKYCGNCGSLFDVDGGKQENYDKVVKEIEQELKKVTKDNYLEITSKTGLGPFITVRFAIGKTKVDWPNGIVKNDPGYMMFSIGGEEDKVTFGVVSQYYNNPVKIRKKTGTLEQVLPYAIKTMKEAIQQVQKEEE